MRIFVLSLKEMICYNFPYKQRIPHCGTAGLKNRKGSLMKKKTILTIIELTSAGFLALLCGGSFYLSSYTVNGKRQSLEDALTWQKAHYDVSWYEELEKEDYVVTGFQDYPLHVQLLKNTAPSDKYIILSHGYTDNRYGSLKYAKMYLDEGFHCIIYDLRGHGLNHPHCCTYSILEGQDLALLVKDTRRRYGETITLGMHGESLGAATTIRALMHTDQADFAVADCGFSEITGILKAGITRMHLPVWLVSCASAANRIHYGYFYSQMRPIEALEKNQIPILFLHGADDTFILPKNSEQMQKATKGYSELHLIPGAGHAQSILKEPALYAEYIHQFLEKTGKIAKGEKIL